MDIDNVVVRLKMVVDAVKNGYLDSYTSDTIENCNIYIDKSILTIRHFIGDIRPQSIECFIRTNEINSITENGDLVFISTDSAFFTIKTDILGLML